ncbi:uncharacterized protein LOC128555951 [Mercenaria mercenaria]|uniref:uncharacterized protein LOC128555951 n=1 Tax=Mercenaria mercenaria TaxID=6596 RepID=UPI00234F6A8E|nr:uncharacterized protein LOC128555951 [Mercenaria mercenaria]
MMSGQISLENLDFIRFIILLIKEGTGVIRIIVVNGLQERNVDLSEFLSRNEEEIRRSKGINQEQKQILYPSSGQTADISNWDTSLLAFLARKYFTTSGSEDHRAVEKIRAWRNKYFHSGTTTVDDGDFEDLSNVIRTISHKYSPSEPPRIDEVINGIKELELHPALEQLKTLDLKSSERIEGMFGVINGHLVTLQRDMQQTYQEVRNLREEIRRVAERDDNEAILSVYSNFYILLSQALCCRYMSLYRNQGGSTVESNNTLGIEGQPESTVEPFGGLHETLLILNIHSEWQGGMTSVEFFHLRLVKVNGNFVSRFNSCHIISTLLAVFVDDPSAV